MTRVLLVEDSDDVLRVFQIELELVGYEVDAVLNAEDALLIARRNAPDVIVSDIGMPGMDGLEFISRIRSMPALTSVPAIALTGTGMEKDIQRALSFGFSAHLTKPVEAAVLVQRIQQLTARRLKRIAS